MVKPSVSPSGICESFDEDHIRQSCDRRIETISQRENVELKQIATTIIATTTTRVDCDSRDNSSEKNDGGDNDSNDNDND